MSLTSNGINSSAIFAVSIIALGILCQSFWSWQDAPFKNEHGVFNYRMAFTPGHTTEVEYVPSESWTAIFGEKIQKKLNKVLQYLFSEYHTVEFLNAREADIDYHVNGFTLVESPMEECDWSVKENREQFYREMEPIIRKLHPDIEELIWFEEAFLQRAVDGANEPAIDGPHLDYHIDQAMIQAWTGYNLSQFDMSIGIWKPDNMDTPVVDYPLAMMDLTTFETTDAIAIKSVIEQTRMDGSVHQVRFVSSLLRYRPQQKWYYYPEQTSNEVILFHQFSNDNTLGTRANFHTSFKVPEFPLDAPSRRSIEMRVFFNFKKEEAKTSF